MTSHDDTLNVKILKEMIRLCDVITSEAALIQGHYRTDPFPKVTPGNMTSLGNVLSSYGMAHEVLKSLLPPRHDLPKGTKKRIISELRSVVQRSYETLSTSLYQSSFARNPFVFGYSFAVALYHGYAFMLDVLAYIESGNTGPIDYILNETEDTSPGASETSGDNVIYLDHLVPTPSDNGADNSDPTKE